MHKELEKQLQAVFGVDGPSLERMQEFLHLVSATYAEFEQKEKGLEGELAKATKKLSKVSQVADETIKTRSQFFATMSHEIRTPLNGVIGMLELLENTCATAEQQDYVKTALASSEMLLGVINDVLDYSKMEAGKLVLEKLEFDFANWFHTTLEIMNVHAERKNIELVGLIFENVPKFVIGDPQRLRQILVNLIGNSIKFTEAGGGVFVCVEVEERDDELLIKFSVSDSGVGIEESEVERIYQAFEQEDVSVSRKFGGTGLGLAISKNLVEQMGGHLWFESKVGIGTSFQFNILSEKSSSNLLWYDIECELEKNLEDVKALVISTSEYGSLVLQDLLSKWGMDVSIAESWVVGRQVLEKESVDIVIVDCKSNLLDADNEFADVKTEIRKFQKDSPVLLLTPTYINHMREAFEDLSCQMVSSSVTFGTLFDSILKAMESNSVFRDKGEKAEQAQSRTILLAEDNAVNKKLTMIILESVGYKVVTAENGAQALEALENNAIDLVLMDIEMPVMDGRDAIKQIRTGEADYSNIPVIALTAHAMQADKAACVELGMNEFLAKPFKKEELLAVIEEQLLQRD